MWLTIYFNINHFPQKVIISNVKYQLTSIPIQHIRLSETDPCLPLKAVNISSVVLKICHKKKAPLKIVMADFRWIVYISKKLDILRDIIISTRNHFQQRSVKSVSNSSNADMRRLLRIFRGGIWSIFRSSFSLFHNIFVVFSKAPAILNNKIHIPKNPHSETILYLHNILHNFVLIFNNKRAYGTNPYPHNPC